MSKCFAALLLCASLGAKAAPAAGNEDEMGRFLSERGLLVHLQEAGQNVTDKASDLVMTAMGFMGVPYRRGGSSAESGFDCSGFVRAMYSQTLGLLLPRSANEQAAATSKIDRQDLQPGDLVFFNTMRRAFSHVGIYVGNGKFIHSPRSGGEVRMEDMGMSYWQRRFDGARRVHAAAPADPSVLQVGLQ